MTGGAVEVRDGKPVLVRVGTGTDATRIRAEATQLAALSGPGVPAVVHFDDGDSEVRLVTEFAPVLMTRSMDERDLAAALATVADVLARAHELGIVHGPVEDTDVRVLDGAVCLTGWGSATDDVGPSDDVTGFGQFVQRLARTPALRGVAQRATTLDRAARPSMTAVADALREIADRSRPTRAVPHRALLGSGIVVLVVLVVLVIVASSARLPGSGESSPRPGPSATGPVRTTTSTTTAPRSAPFPVDVRNTGNVLVHDGGRWTVGRPGDVVVVGDWDCNGTSTPAVLRPATGRVWMFPGWPDDGRPIAGTFVATLPGATAVRVREDGRCHRLEVVDEEGQSTTVG